MVRECNPILSFFFCGAVNCHGSCKKREMLRWMIVKCFTTIRLHSLVAFSCYIRLLVTLPLSRLIVLFILFNSSGTQKPYRLALTPGRYFRSIQFHGKDFLGPCCMIHAATRVVAVFIYLVPPALLNRISKANRRKGMAIHRP